MLTRVMDVKLEFVEFPFLAGKDLANRMRGEEVSITNKGSQRGSLACSNVRLIGKSARMHDVQSCSFARSRVWVDLNVVSSTEFLSRSCSPRVTYSATSRGPRHRNIFEYFRHLNVSAPGYREMLVQLDLLQLRLMELTCSR